VKHQVNFQLKSCPLTAVGRRENGWGGGLGRTLVSTYLVRFVCLFVCYKNMPQGEIVYCRRKF